MKLQRTLTAAAIAIAVGAMTAPLTACGDGKDAKSANVTPGPMPEGETWTGVYYHPVFGYLHMQENDAHVIAKWKRTDQSAWGELSGVHNGNVLHFTWKEHRYGMVGPSATQSGKGYFVYKMNKETPPNAEIDGQYGLDANETGSDWHNIKQQRMVPDMKSITGDTPGGNTGPAGLE